MVRANKWQSLALNPERVGEVPRGLLWRKWVALPLDKVSQGYRLKEPQIQIWVRTNEPPFCENDRPPTPREVRGFLCKCPRQKGTYPRVTLTRAPPFQLNDGLLMSKARNASRGGEYNSLLSLSKHRHASPRRPSPLCTLHSPRGPSMCQTD